MTNPRLTLETELLDFAKATTQLARDPSIQTANKANSTQRTAWGHIYNSALLVGESPLYQVKQFLDHSSQCSETLTRTEQKAEDLTKYKLRIQYRESLARLLITRGIRAVNTAINKQFAEGSLQHNYKKQKRILDPKIQFP